MFLPSYLVPPRNFPRWSLRAEDPTGKIYVKAAVQPSEGALLRRLGSASAASLVRPTQISTLGLQVIGTVCLSVRSRSTANSLKRQESRKTISHPQKYELKDTHTRKSLEKEEGVKNAPNTTRKRLFRSVVARHEPAVENR
jgi:hypothetical protein